MGRTSRFTNEHSPAEQASPAADVLDYQIVPAQPYHGRGVYEVICRANDFDPSEYVSGVFGLEDWDAALRHFPEGQFVAVTRFNGVETVIGVALAIKTNYAPSRAPRSWRDMIGDLDLHKNDPEGRWLYGVEKAVDPDHQGRGIGKALYSSQFELVRRLGLHGIYAGGMLKGYKNHRHHMSVREYAAKVMNGELFDPTISVQMRRGFKPRTLIENYVWDHECNHTGMLIVWDNPDKTSKRPARVSGHSALQSAL